MQLFGSTTSPYVRRLRLWLTGDDYEFVNIDIFSKAGREVLKANNPALKIPMLLDEAQVIYDSRVIYRYLNQKFYREKLSWDDENNLTLIDAANDSLIELFLLARSGVAGDSDLMFVKLQQERITNLMSLLEDKTGQGVFAQWNYVAISLYCLLDWIQFRSLYDLSALPALTQFIEQHSHKPEVIDTDPRKA